MYKRASHHHGLGMGLQEYLLEDGEEKTALYGAVTGPVGNYMGERDAERALRRKGYSPSQIEAAREKSRGKFKSGLSGLGYQLGGNVLGLPGGKAGIIIGGLAGAGLGGYRNYKIKRRGMMAKARELRGMDSEKKASLELNSDSARLDLLENFYAVKEASMLQGAKNFVKKPLNLIKKNKNPGPAPVGPTKVEDARKTVEQALAAPEKYGVETVNLNLLG